MHVTQMEKLEKTVWRYLELDMENTRNTPQPRCTSCLQWLRFCYLPQSSCAERILFWMGVCKSPKVCGHSDPCPTFSNLSDNRPLILSLIFRVSNGLRLATGFHLVVASLRPITPTQRTLRRHMRNIARHLTVEDSERWPYWPCWPLKCLWTELCSNIFIFMSRIVSRFDDKWLCPWAIKID